MPMLEADPASAPMLSLAVESNDFDERGGQFAADYRRLFGELLSGTLADARRDRQR
jgi:hypothetical protein